MAPSLQAGFTTAVSPAPALPSPFLGGATVVPGSGAAGGAQATAFAAAAPAPASAFLQGARASAAAADASGSRSDSDVEFIGTGSSAPAPAAAASTASAPAAVPPASRYPRVIAGPTAPITQVPGADAATWEGTAVTRSLAARLCDACTVAPVGRCTLCAALTAAAATAPALHGWDDHCPETGRSRAKELAEAYIRAMTADHGIGTDLDLLRRRAAAISPHWAVVNLGRGPGLAVWCARIWAAWALHGGEAGSPRGINTAVCAFVKRLPPTAWLGSELPRPEQWLAGMTDDVAMTTPADHWWFMALAAISGIRILVIHDMVDRAPLVFGAATGRPVVMAWQRARQHILAVVADPQYVAAIPRIPSADTDPHRWREARPLAAVGAAPAGARGRSRQQSQPATMRAHSTPIQRSRTRGGDAIPGAGGGGGASTTAAAAAL